MLRFCPPYGYFSVDMGMDTMGSANLSVRIIERMRSPLDTFPHPVP